MICLHHENTSGLRNDLQNCAEIKSVNYCITGMMSRCSAGLGWNKQQHCKFARKSTLSNRCMHYIESIDAHCDCVAAQKELTSRQ